MPLPTETMEERFNKHIATFIRPTSVGQYDEKGVNIGFLPSNEVVLKFIQSELSLYQNRILEEVKGMIAIDIITPDRKILGRNLVNKADIIKLISKKDN